MADYIKRENAKRAVWGCARDTGIDEAPFEYAEGLLEDVPSEDVAPVRHGKWEMNDDYTCSLCGYRMVIGDGAYHYFPNCGARMDGDEDDD